MTLPPASPAAKASRPAPTGTGRSGVMLLLRAEAVAAVAGAVWAYAALDGSWVLFALLFLVPDLSMAGYLSGPKVGGAVYNAAHTYVSPALLAALGLGLGLPLLPALACVWVAHIGLDRALGFGLKRETGFGDTHLGRVGRR